MNIRRIDVGIIEILVATIVITSMVMLAQLVLGVFTPLTALLIGTLFTGVLGLLFITRVNWPALRTLQIVFVIALLALLPRLNPFLYVWGGQDEGIYVSMSSHFTRTGGLTIKDTVREQLPPAAKIAYDKPNQTHNVKTLQNLYEGEHEPGIFIKNLDHSEYIFQFYPLHPQWMSLFAELMGDSHRVYSLVFFSLLNILMLSLLAYELVGEKLGAGVIVAALLAINPMHVFFSRFPVTENVTVFFSAAGFYFLVRYFKSREEGLATIHYLFLSSGAWICLFFNHIAGFMYAPILAFILLVGIVTANGRGQMLHLLFYGIGIIGGYGLSLWYGLKWSFPYSYEIYKAVFGVNAGIWLVNHWESIILLALVACYALCEVAWALRRQANSLWVHFNLRQIISWLLIIVVFATLVYGVREAYWLGFTDHYKDNALLTPYLTRFGFNNGGWNAFFHSSIVSLTIYLSPFIYFFILIMLPIRARSLNIYFLVLLLFISIFLIVRTSIDNILYYYYYGRYLCGELLPYLTLLAALFLHSLLANASFRRRFVVGIVLATSLAWEAVALQMQYPGGEMNRLDESLRPLVNRIKAEDLLVLAVHGDGWDINLKTALDYYYGKKTMFLYQDKLQENLPSVVGSNFMGDVYILSYTSDLADDLTYLECIRMRTNHYSHGGFNVLPHHGNSVGETRLYLYKVGHKRFNLKRIDKG